MEEKHFRGETLKVVRILIFVEGQTEESFVKNMLSRHFYQFDIFLYPIISQTSKKESKQQKGGISSYAKIKNQLNILCKSDQSAYVTTMIDYYRFPKDFPGKDDLLKIKNSFNRALELEKCFGKDISLRNFIPNLMIHEFEGLLYSRPEAFAAWFPSLDIAKLEIDKSLFPTPEHIDDDPETAPSKRILKYCPSYQKVHHGTSIALDIGLDNIRRACKHFDHWITMLESLK